jgi:predicted nucleic acid-binding protein
MFLNEAAIVGVTERIGLCRDPRDDRFLEVAVAGGASRLVTGDRDLLTLDPFRNIRIVSPAALLDEFASRRS